MFQPLLDALVDLRARTSRFRRVALHLHSPDSHDWPHHTGDPALNSPERFSGNSGLQAFADELKEHLDFICVTDHMRHDFATRLCSHVGTNDDFMTLPGIEVNFRLEPPLGFARIHLLTILPEGATNECFARLFSGLPDIPPDAERSGQEEVTGLTLQGWVDRVHAENGLCIAAHVDNNQGIRHHFRQIARETLQLICGGNGVEEEQANNVPDNLKEYLFDSGLDAIEIHRDADACHYRWVSTRNGRLRSIATTLTFDAHSIEDFARIDRVTHIKMTTLGLNGLRQALTFPDTRIRYPANLPTPPNPRLLGIEIQGSDNSFFEDIRIAFAENLNCLIGVRGSGKSTIVEALRYVFGYNMTLEELDGELASSVKKLQDTNLAGSIIRVIYRTASDEDRVLEATFDEKSSYATRVFDINGDPIHVDNVEATGEYPLRLYGWSEIENLGREPSRQRDLLDRLVPELFDVLQRRAEIRNELQANRGEVSRCIQAVSAAFAADNSDITRYQEFVADFERQNTDDVKSLFASLDLANAKRRILDRVNTNATALIERLNATTPITLQADLDPLLEQGSQELRDWWLEEEMGRLGIVQSEQDADAFVRQAIARVNQFQAVVAEHIRELDATVARVEHDLREQFAEDTSMQLIADLRANAEQRLTRVKTLRTTYQSAWAELTKSLSDRQAIVDRLTSVQNEIAGIRARHNEVVEKTLNEFLPDDMKVTIDFEAGGDIEDFASHLYAIFGARSNQRKHIRSTVASTSVPTAFAKLLLDSDEQGLAAAFSDLDSADIELCISETHPFETHEGADVQVLRNDGEPLAAILNLQEAAWDDREMILLNGGPVDRKSPGQRSSAMLPLIALAQDTPLVIDQPEDNLDKRLIGTVLMKVLAVLKEKRQIIVCTHDPNILVGGDAEQVVVLEAESDRKGSVSNHGSIDNPDIVDTVVNLLEGGAAAFEVRHRRYRGRAGIPA